MENRGNEGSTEDVAPLAMPKSRIVAPLNDSAEWRDDESVRLIQFVRDGCSIRLIASKLKRTQFSIRAEIVRQRQTR